MWTGREEAEEWTGHRAGYEDGLAYGWRLLCEWAGAEAPLTARTACMRCDEADKGADGNGRFLECGYQLAVRRSLIPESAEICEAHYARASKTRKTLQNALRREAAAVQTDLFAPAAPPAAAAAVQPPWKTCDDPHHCNETIRVRPPAATAAACTAPPPPPDLSREFSDPLMLGPLPAALEYQRAS